MSNMCLSGISLNDMWQSRGSPDQWIIKRWWSPSREDYCEGYLEVNVAQRPHLHSNCIRRRKRQGAKVSGTSEAQTSNVLFWSLQRILAGTYDRFNTWSNIISVVLQYIILINVGPATCKRQQSTLTINTIHYFCLLIKK